MLQIKMQCNSEHIITPLYLQYDTTMYTVSHKRKFTDKIELLSLYHYAADKLYESHFGSNYEFVSLIYDERLLMSRFQSTTFINVKLQESDKRKATEWGKKTNIDLVAVGEILAQDNVKFSFSYSVDKDAVIVSLTGTKDNPFNSHSCMTTWGKDLPTALMWAMYKHIVMFSREEWIQDADDAMFG